MQCVYFRSFLQQLKVEGQRSLIMLTFIKLSHLLPLILKKQNNILRSPNSSIRTSRFISLHSLLNSPTSCVYLCQKLQIQFKAQCQFLTSPIPAKETGTATDFRLEPKWSALYCAFPSFFTSTYLNITQIYFNLFNIIIYFLYSLFLSTLYSVMAYNFILYYIN